LKFSRIRLEQTDLRAPTGGVVLVKQAEAGEVIAPGSPILTLGDLENVWLRAYISETNLGRIRWGQPATLRTDTFPEKTYEGRISFISSKAEFTPKTIETHEERVKLVYRIKISVENRNQELKPGMPADAVIETNGAIDTAGETAAEPAGETPEQESEQD
jgi:HlyD family secretion protein